MRVAVVVVVVVAVVVVVVVVVAVVVVVVVVASTGVCSSVAATKQPNSTFLSHRSSEVFLHQHMLASTVSAKELSAIE